jgi:ketosteroid isomerase-like protein
MGPTNYVGWTDEPVYYGHDGVREMMRGWVASFDDWEATLERAVSCGDDVLAVVVDRAYMKDGSRPLVRRHAVRFTFQAGRIVRARFYSDVSDALKAVGLAE